MKIDINKKYQTINEKPVRIYATDGGRDGDLVHGAWCNAGSWVNTTWDSDGAWHSDHQGGSYYHNKELSLIEVKDKKQLKGFIHVKKMFCLYNQSNVEINEFGPTVAIIDLSKHNIFYEENEGI